MTYRRFGGTVLTQSERRTVRRQAADGYRNTDHIERGFTLIELIVVLAVLPIVVGALAVGILSVFSLQSGVSTRLSDSDDAQLVSANFVKDVQSATNLTTDQNESQCGTGVQLLGLEWSPNNGTGTYGTTVSYVKVPNSTGGSDSLVRQECTSGSSTPSSTTVSYNISADQPAPNITGGDSADASTQWISTANVTGVTFSISELEQGDNPYSYTLSATPRTNSTPLPDETPTDAPSCGFAAKGTGTYASDLCFVDFSALNSLTQAQQSEVVAPNCLPMSAAIANTPFTLSFCFSMAPTSTADRIGPVFASPIPTYLQAGSAAYLGNNGFYTEIPGDPALYTTTQGYTSVLTFSNIKVTDALGAEATNWQLVTGDAESTDTGESITWSTVDPSDPNDAPSLNLLDNNLNSAYGNACAYPGYPGGVDLTGVGTPTVECAAGVPSVKTGTVMLAAADPAYLTSTLVGAGLQAIFIGLLLPS